MVAVRRSGRGAATRRWLSRARRRPPGHRIARDEDPPFAGIHPAAALLGRQQCGYGPHDGVPCRAQRGAIQGRPGRQAEGGSARSDGDLRPPWDEPPPQVVPATRPIRTIGFLGPRWRASPHRSNPGQPPVPAAGALRKRPRPPLLSVASAKRGSRSPAPRFHEDDARVARHQPATGQLRISSPAG